MPSPVVLIVEDEVIVSEEISEYLERVGYTVSAKLTTAPDAIEHIEKNAVDIALLDINLQGTMDGIALAAYLRTHHPCAILFLTALADDATLERASRVHPEAYLIKPFDYRNLYASINLAFENFSSRALIQQNNQQLVTDRVFLSDGQKYHKVFISDILFLEASGSYCHVVTPAASYSFSFNLKEATDRMVHPDLVRVHRSFVVNIKNIDSVDGNQLQLGKHTVQMGPSFKEGLLRRLNLLR